MPNRRYRVHGKSKKENKQKLLNRNCKKRNILNSNCIFGRYAISTPPEAQSNTFSPKRETGDETLEKLIFQAVGDILTEVG